MRGVLSLLCGAAAAAASSTPFPTLDGIVREYVDGIATHVQSNDYSQLAIRDVAMAAWTSIYLSPTPNSTLITSLLDLVFAHQLPDGQWPWQFYMDECIDLNGVQFTSLPILRLIVEHPEVLPAGWVQGKMAQLQAAASASIIEGFSEAQPFYTNIYSMRLTNLQLFAQVTGNATVAAYAAQAVSSWAAMLDGAGIHEFDSPTYTAVAFANIYSGIGSIRNATVVSMLQRVAAFFASDAAASYFPPALEVGGAHSRDYDFLFGAAGMDWWMVLTGIAGACNSSFGSGSWVSGSDGITMAHLWVAYLRGEVPYLAGTPTAALACGPQALPTPADWRLLQASYSQIPGPVTPLNGSDRTTFIAQAVSLGTSSQWYGQQDKMMLAQLPPGAALNRTALPRSAQITFVPDRYDAPYGLVIAPDRSGHEKPMHLQFTVAAVQDRGAALLLEDLTAEFRVNGKNTNYTSIAANVVLPIGDAVDALYVNGQKLSAAAIRPGAPSIALPPNSTVAVRAQGGAVAFRLLPVDGIAGYTPSYALQFDSPEGKFAGRLTGYLYRGANLTFPTPQSIPPTSRTGVMLAVGQAQGDADALSLLQAVAAYTLSSSLSSKGVWTVTVTPGAAPPPSTAFPGLTSTFTAAINIPGTVIAARQLNGSNLRMPVPGALQVSWSNGTAVTITPHA